MYAPEVEITLWGHVGNVGGDLLLFAKLPDYCRGSRIIDSHKDHLCALKVLGLKDSVDVGHLFFRNTMENLRVEARGRANDGDIGIGIETVQNTTGSDLRA